MIGNAAKRVLPLNKRVANRCDGAIRSCWDDDDFGYLKNKSKATQREATWYEYARESDEIIAAVQRRRRGYKFPQALKDVYSRGELDLLVGLTGFPTESYEALLSKGHISKKPLHDRLWCSPWDNLKRRFRQQPRGAATLEEYLEAKFKKGTICVLSIPWELPNSEIIRQLAKQVSFLRPKKFWAFERPGRRGSPQTVSGMEMLKQLSAFRVRARGECFKAYSGFGLYQSRKGWTGAARAAKKRIMELPTTNLFS